MTDDRKRQVRTFKMQRNRPISKHKKMLFNDLLPTLSIDSNAESICPKDVFGNDHETWFEIGFGGGEHLAGQALKNPDINIIGCEPFVNGFANILGILEHQPQTHSSVRLYQGDAFDLLKKLPKGSISRIFLLFPDPWHKTRHQKRRFINQENLDLLAGLLCKGGTLRIASDDFGYIKWSMRHTCRHPSFRWTAETCGSWRTPPSDWINTRYEQKAISQGKRPIYLDFTRT